MTTFADLIADTRSHFMTGQSDRLNILDLDVDALTTTTTLQFRYELQGIAPGTRLGIDLEEFHVLSTSGSTAQSTATVIRGYNGSTPASHTAGTTIRVNPQISDFRIGQRLNQCLRSLSGHGLFYIKPIEVTYNPATRGYNFTAADFLDTWRIRYDIPGPDNVWPVLNRLDYYVDTHPDPDEFPGGRQLVLRSGGFSGQPVRLSYKATFADLTTITDDVAVVSGLQLPGHDIPPMGAAIRLLAGREIKRSFLNRQPEPRRQEEVPPGAANQSMRPLVELYYDSIDRHRDYLAKLYPEQV
jgi:hypothetical protein